jgi:RNA polymerase sigma-70 factor (ECF subfamily)
VETQRWRTLRDALARAVRRQCPAWLRSDADDIAQVAVTRVMARAGEGNPGLSSFYLHKVAHSALVDEIRRRRRRREEALEFAAGPGEATRTHEPLAHGDATNAVRLRELGEAVRGCLLAMKRERRLAVMLHLQEHTVPEAARILGWAAKSTENFVYRGLADLRRCLRTKGHAP